MDAKHTDYVEIAKHGRRLGSKEYYITEQQQKALADKAPLNAVYFSIEEQRWITTDEMEQATQ